MRTSQRIGVAMYAEANPLNREGNWACEFRGEPFEFASASDLPAQILWVTNCSYEDIAKAGLRLKPNIANDAFFRTRLSQMGMELGIGDLDMKEQASLLAEILGCAADMARVQLGMVSYPSNGLAHAVGQFYGLPEAPKNSPIERIAERACQRYTACERDRRHDKNAEVFTFWMPRFTWADRLLKEPLPVNTDLKALQSHQLPDNGQNPVSLLEWAEEKQLPIFAKVIVHALEPTVGKLMNYGAGAEEIASKSYAGAEYNARNFREWCSRPELSVLVEAGEVEVQQVALAGGWNGTGMALFHSKAASVSYSYGLVAENLWVGQTRSAAPGGYITKTLSTAWLQALDRMECLKIAERLFSMGFEIISYGYGRITVVCPMSVRALIPQVAREYGLLYPAKIDQLDHLPANKRSPDSILQTLLSQRDYGSIVRVNNMALKELEAARGA